MGLFGPKKTISDDLLKKIETVDFDLEENESILSIVEGEKNKAITDNDSMLIYKAFLTNIINEKVASSLMRITGDAMIFKKFLFEAWQLEEAIKKNNVFRLVMNNESFENYLDKDSGFHSICSSSASPFWRLYSSYCDCDYDVEDAEDPDSIIFNKSLWFDDHKNEIREYIAIDRQLKSDPEKRKSILYKKDDNDYLPIRVRSLKYIKKDLGMDD